MAAPSSSLKPYASSQLGYIPARDGSPLYCVYHAPAAGHSRRAVLMAPPLFEERKNAFGFFRRLAEKLAGAGYPVLRFDFRGSGESGGAAAARRWAHLAEDTASAHAALRELSGCNASVLLGARLSATLLLQEASRNTDSPVIALAPVIKGAAQVRLWKMRSKIRAELSDAAQALVAFSAEGTLDFDGYTVNPAFFEDVARIDLLRECSPALQNVHIVQVSHRADAVPESSELLSKLGERARLTPLRLEPFWERMDDADTQALEQVVMDAVRER